MSCRRSSRSARVSPSTYRSCRSSGSSRLWLGWWPGTLERSWAFDALNLGSGPAVLGGLLWVAAGLALVGAGLGWLGVSVVSNQWQILALIGAVLGLGVLALYFHPFYVVAIVIDVVIVAICLGSNRRHAMIGRQRKRHSRRPARIGTHLLCARSMTDSR
jgi:hypothetical protein